MKRNINHFFIGILILLSLASCTSIGRISIQVAQPPKIEIGNEIQTLLVLNGALTSSFKDYNADSLESLLVDNRLVVNKLLFDSLAADTALIVVANALNESGRFQAILPLERNIDNSSLPNGKKQKLKPEDINQLCEKFQADAILILSDFSQKLKSEVTLIPRIEFETPTETSAFFESTIDLAYNTKWYLLHASNRAFDKQFLQTDTISWQTQNSDIKGMYEAMPLMKSVLLNGGIEVGLSLAEQIVPIWKDESRYFFQAGSEDIAKAATLIKSSEWIKAKNILINNINNSSAAKRSKIEFNLALVSEMNGDIDEAIEWCRASLKTRYSKEADRYLRLLTKRKQLIAKLS